MNKVPEAINSRTLAQDFQLKILESKDAISRCIVDVASFHSRITQESSVELFEQGPENS
jgi:hypothetical protein